MYGLLESLEQSQSERWLGNIGVVEGLLRQFVHSLLSEKMDPEEFSKELMDGATQLAKVFLGQSKEYPGPKWFSPGQIDVLVGRQEGIDSEDPVERVAGGLIEMIGEFLKLTQSIQKENTLPEQWQWQANAIIEYYVKLFMGLPTGYTQKESKKANGQKSYGSPRLTKSINPPNIFPSPFS